MDSTIFNLAKYPLQHIEKMDSDIRRYSTRSARITFPRNYVPSATWSDVGQINIIFFVVSACIHLHFQFCHRGVESELLNRKDTPALFFNDFFKCINVPWIQY